MWGGESIGGYVGAEAVGGLLWALKFLCQKSESLSHMP